MENDAGVRGRDEALEADRDDDKVGVVDKPNCKYCKVLIIDSGDDNNLHTDKYYLYCVLNDGDCNYCFAGVGAGD